MLKSLPLYCYMNTLPMQTIKLDYVEQAIAQLNTADEQARFRFFYQKYSKNLGYAYLLLIFFGIFGLHKLYLNKKSGWLYFIFCWTMIPFILLFIDLFLLPFQVTRYNRELAVKLVELIKYYHSNNDGLINIDNKIQGNKTKLIEWVIALVLIFAVIVPSLSYVLMTLTHHRIEFHYKSINPDGSQISNILSF